MQHSEDKEKVIMASLAGMWKIAKTFGTWLITLEYLNAEPGLFENTEQLIVILHDKKVNLVL